MALTWAEKMEAKGKVDLLLFLLTERFGPLPESARRSIEEIKSPQALKRLAKRVLTAGSLEEMKLA